MINAGRWGAYCIQCQHYYMTEPAVNIDELLANNREFRVLTETREALRLKSSSSHAGNATSSATLTSLKTLVIWFENGQRPTCVSTEYHLGSSLRLSDLKLKLGQYGIEYNTDLECFDRHGGRWVPLRWYAKIPCDGHVEILIQYTGLTDLSDHDLFFDVM
ncbi:hypothetical protein NP233_g11210 [Leucocoprinus birnbaumii]|uniref:Uncharacterized protein n=1 Tax=Leucocoprinus birnbaumii TaxID=56174 RepID=A0AAD5VHC0_9AGAR|nr:hypothetical protein NP233_g11210 [Leucocoprinus birnbaumii]